MPWQRIVQLCATVRCEAPSLYMLFSPESISLDVLSQKAEILRPYIIPPPPTIASIFTVELYVIQNTYCT